MFNLFNTTKAYPDLAGHEFKNKWKAAGQPALIDVRTRDEFKAGTLPGATNIDFFSPSFREQFGKLDKSKEYFLFCRSGNRSGQACKLLAREGYKVHNLAGGIGAWPF